MLSEEIILQNDAELTKPEIRTKPDYRNLFSCEQTIATYI